MIDADAYGITDGQRIKGLDVKVYDVYETELEAIEKTLELNHIELKIRPYENKLIRDYKE